MEECAQQDKMIKQEYESLAGQRQEQIKRSSLSSKNEEMWSDANYQPAKASSLNKHDFNIYADKLLVHLVVEEEFEFGKISQIMTYAFKYENKLYTEQICRQRWYELHSNRLVCPLGKGIGEAIIKTTISTQQAAQKNTQTAQTTKISENPSPKQPNNTNHGYNIFKDSIRKIDDLQKYNHLQKQMKSALEKAALSIELQKPMLYTPYYDRLQQFQVLQEQLTLEKMQQLMSHPIEMELMERQLKVLDLNQTNFQSKVKKEVDKKVRQDKIQNQEEFQIQQDWDQYESD